LPVVRCITCVGVVVAFGLSCASAPPAVDFSDALTGPVSPSFVIPFHSYALTPEGLLRTFSESGTENGVERPIVRTVSGGYLARDFVFEVDVTIPAAHGDIAFVGFGSAEGNVASSNEPSQAFLFRIHNLPRMRYFSVDAAVGDPDPASGRYRELHRLADYTPGTPMRFRIMQQAGAVTLAVPAIAGARVTFPIDKARGLFDNDNAHLLFGNSSRGTTFRNASLRRP
jgi:hypothetical protein